MESILAKDAWLAGKVSPLPRGRSIPIFFSIIFTKPKSC